MATVAPPPPARNDARAADVQVARIEEARRRSGADAANKRLMQLRREGVPWSVAFAQVDAEFLMPERKEP